MIKFLGRRLAASILIMAIAGTMVFFSIHILPGDPVLILLGEQGASNPEVVARIRAQLNLDVSLPQQLWLWLKGLAAGDLGKSLENGLPVVEVVSRRIPRSLEIILVGLAIAAIMGIPLGTVAARHRQHIPGTLASALAVVGFSSPVFVTGILLIIFFSLWLGLLPSSGYTAFSEDPLQHILYLCMPALAIGINFMGVVTRVSRASLSDILQRDFIRTARAKGLSESRTVYRHALPNALIPVIAVIGVRCGNLLGGTVIIESLFDWPGLSSLLVHACFARDYPIIQGTLLAIFALFILISLLIDLALGLIDPRMRIQS